MSVQAADYELEAKEEKKEENQDGKYQETRVSEIHGVSIHPV